MALDPQLSLKLRRLSMLTMLTVVYVHACNFEDRYLWAGRLFTEPMDINSFTQIFLDLGVFRFGIPLFFLRSGFLMADTELRYTPATRVKKRFITLILPYLAWSFFGFALTWLFELQPITNSVVESSWLRPYNNTPIHDLSWWQLISSYLFGPVSFQLWFLRNLFIYSALYPLIVKAVDQYPKIYFPIIALAWLLSVGLYVIEGEGLLAFSLGIWLNRNRMEKIMNTQWIDKLKLFWWLPVVLVLKTWLSFQPWEWGTPVIYFTYKFTQPFLLLAVWRGYDLLFGKASQTTWTDELSRYNFFVYGFHVPILYYATDYCFSIWGRTPNHSLAIFIFLPVLIILMAVWLGSFTRMISRPAFKILTGGRE